jgi:cytidylate kinase
MIISFNGDHGSGKSTIAERVAKDLNYPRYYMGQIFRDLAKEKNITLAELHNLCKNDPETDKQVDEYLVKLSKEQSDFIIESRTAWYFIPNSLKIYLKVSEEEGAARIYKELQTSASRKEEDANLNSIEDTQKSEKKRKEEDDARYKKYYGIDIHQEKNYDLVVDTTSLNRDEVFNKVMRAIRVKLNA